MMSSSPEEFPPRSELTNLKIYHLASTGELPPLTRQELADVVPDEFPQLPVEAGAGTVFERVASDLRLEKFVDELPIPPVIKVPSNGGPIQIRAEVIRARVHRDLPETELWAYNGSVPGPTLETRRGQEVRVEWINGLVDDQGNPARLPYDVVRVEPREGGRGDVETALWPGGRSTATGEGADSFPPLPGTQEVTGWTVVHVHGALTNGHDDGWAHNVTAPGESALHRYPNNQSARTMWYHDHTMAVTRFNVYAGLAGFWLIRDEVEDSLGLPDRRRELPLMISDRNFETDTNGNYTGRFLYKQAGTLVGTEGPNPQAGEISVTGPFNMVNGKIWPTTSVDGTWYRLRLLNASNSRALTLALHDPELDPQDKENADVIWDPNTTRLQGRMKIIAAEGGLFAAPLDPPQRPVGDAVTPDDTTQPLSDTVRLGPAERVDVLVNFNGLEGKDIELRNEVGTALTIRLGLADASVMRFQVKRTRSRHLDWAPPSSLNPDASRHQQLEDGRLQVGSEILEDYEQAWVGLIPPGSGDNPHPQLWELRVLSPEEDPGSSQLIQVQNADGSITSLKPVSKLFDDTTTIRLTRGKWALWHFLNLGVPAHPMHIHMTDFQMVGRRRLDGVDTNNNAHWDLTAEATRQPLPVAPLEIDDLRAAQKETWSVAPGEWISVLGHFEGAAGSFMYHCHILDHEDHTMMRPFTVLPPEIMTLHTGHTGDAGH